MENIISKFIKAISNAGFAKLKSPSELKTYSDEVKFGNAGRLKIPTLNIGVPLYDTRTGTAQQIVDNDNSAAFLHWEKQCAIVDHCYQSNFSNLKYVRPGQTILVIEQPNGESKKYICVKAQIGYIQEDPGGRNRIYDHNWQPAREQNEGGICIYTCLTRSKPDVMNIMLTYWQPVSHAQ